MDKKVLIIDDDLDLLEWTRQVLDDNGYEVVACRDGEDGLEKTKTDSFHLIVLDVQMPNMDGYTFLKQLQKNELIWPIPVIVLTGQDKVEDLFKVAGIAEYLVKPVTEHQLLAAVSRQIS